LGTSVLPSPYYLNHGSQNNDNHIPANQQLYANSDDHSSANNVHDSTNNDDTNTVILQPSKLSLHQENYQAELTDTRL
jgi:hypothetical protein